MSASSAVPVAVKGVRFSTTPVTTRLPFRFGAVTVTGFRLLSVAVTVEVAGHGTSVGLASDNLMPKWFDKRPEPTAEQNAEDLLTSARIAAEVYTGLGSTPRPVFALWREAYPAARAKANAAGLNGLVGAFGSALIERAVIDALGRALGKPLSTVLSANLIGIDPGAVHQGVTTDHLHAWADRTPAREIALRHTVGMLDPLAGTTPADQSDGLPRTLEEYIGAQGLTHFKLKLGGNIAADVERLAAIASVLDARVAAPYRATLDGNEQYKDAGDVAVLLDQVAADPRLARLWASLLFVEQPLERAVALDPKQAAGVRAAGERRAVIIDESDDSPDSFSRALAMGYRGVSTKNCKGVIKSFLNRTLMEARGGEAAGVFMSAEDLTNLGVVPLQQDLDTVLALGLTHVERNGHHYIRGLDHLSAGDRDAALKYHPDLYEARDGGVFLKVTGGQIATGSVVDADGYGVAFTPEFATGA